MNKHFSYIYKNNKGDMKHKCIMAVMSKEKNALKKKKERLMRFRHHKQFSAEEFVKIRHFE